MMNQFLTTTATKVNTKVSKQTKVLLSYIIISATTGAFAIIIALNGL